MLSIQDDNHIYIYNQILLINFLFYSKATEYFKLIVIPAKEGLARNLHCDMTMGCNKMIRYISTLNNLDT